jgi:PAS domain S-box-containing protein
MPYHRHIRNIFLSVWNERKIAGYVVGVIFFIVTFFTSIELYPFEPFREIPFIISFLGVVLTASFGGFFAGMFSTFLSLIATNYFFVNGSFWNESYLLSSSNWLRMFSLFLEGTFASLVIDRLHQAREKALIKSELSIKDVQFLRGVLDSLFVFVGVTTPKGTLLETNKAAIRSSNLTFRDVIGKKIYRTYWWSYSDEAKRTLRQAIKKAKISNPIRYDTQMRVADGKIITVDFSIATLKNNEGEIEYLVMSAVDVNARTEALKENLKLYREIKKQKSITDNIISEVPGVVWELNKKPGHQDLRLSFVSNYEEIMLGHKIGSCIKNPDFWKEVIYKEDRNRVIRDIERVFKKQKPITTQFRCIDVNNKLIWVESRFVANTDYEGNSVGVEGVMSDISDRVKLEQTKDEFVNIASHEIKTPLATIKAFAQIAEKRLKRLKDWETFSYLEKMNLYIDKLNQIISDFMDFSKIESGKLQYYEEEFDLGSLVKDVAEDMQSIAENHKIILKDIISQKITGDKNRISQVLINLISNAIKYSPQAEQIIINMDLVEDKIIVEVTDFGIGIPKESQKKIFDKFYRVKYPKKQTIEGFGIGLYISAEIIKRHNGKIWVNSEENQGSTFYFSLPIKKNE